MSKNPVAAGFMIFRKFQDSIEYLILQTSYGTHHWTPPKGRFNEILVISLKGFDNFLPNKHILQDLPTTSVHNHVPRTIGVYDDTLYFLETF